MNIKDVVEIDPEKMSGVPVVNVSDLSKSPS
jgi:hypothetical protein